MSESWIMVANGVHARLFAKNEKEPLREVACYANPDGHAPQRNAGSDRLPRTHESSTPARHAIEPRLNPREKSHQRFARSLRVALEEGRTSRSFDKLVLVAAPHFLGMLHHCLGKQLMRLVAREIRHDFTNLDPTELEERLAEPRCVEPTVSVQQGV